MSGVLGLEVPTYTDESPVIGEIEQSSTGNTILRIGTHSKSRPAAWVSVLAHIVLSPDERERLITELIGHRR